MTQFRRRPSGLWVPEARAYRPGAFGGLGGPFRSRGPVVTVTPSAAPTISSISPSTGPAGTEVTITGTNFVASGLVTTVGGVALSPRQLVNSTTIIGTVGAHADGAVNVYVETSFGNATLVNGYTYAAGAEPVYAAAAGQTLILSDNFDAYAGYANADVMITNNDPVQPGAAGDTTHRKILTPGRNGSDACLRMVYDAIGSPVQETHSFVTYPENQAITSADPHHSSQWVRVTVDGDMTGIAIPIKWFQFWHNAGGNHWQYSTRSRSCVHGSGISNLHMGIGASEIGCNSDQPVGPYPINYSGGYWDGLWHRVAYSLLMNTTAGSPSSQDGYARMWVDGTKIMDISAATVGVTPGGGTKVWCTAAELDGLPARGGGPATFGRLLWGGPFTGTNGLNPFTYDVDDLTWWRGNAQ